MFGQSIGFNYTQEQEHFKTACSGLISIAIKVVLLIVIYLRLTAIIDKSDNLYGLFENIIDEN